MAQKLGEFLPRPLALVVGGVDKVFEVFTVGLFLIFVVLTFIQVILRYVFADSILWADEVCRYMFIWTTFVAAGLVIGKGKHISIEMLRPLVSEGIHRILGLMSDALIIVFSVFMIVYGWKIIRISFTVIAPATEIPMAYFQMVFIVFGVVCTYRSLVHMVLLVRATDTEIE